MAYLPPSCAKCFDCIIPDPHTCFFTCVNVVAFVGGGDFGDPPGTITPTIPAPASNEQLRDRHCALRRAEGPPGAGKGYAGNGLAGVGSPGRWTETCYKHATIVGDGTYQFIALLPGMVGTRPGDGDDPSDSPL